VIGWVYSVYVLAITNFYYALHLDFLIFPSCHI
jgi:hypothetical protein